MNVEDLIDASQSFFNMGRVELAKTLLLQAIKVKPDCVAAWSNLALVDLQLGLLEEAEKAAQTAISIDSTFAAAWHNLGEVYANMDQAEQSLVCNNRALLLNAEQAVFWLGRGNALMMLKRYTEAMDCFDQALAVDPQLTDARMSKEVAWLLSDPQREKLLSLAIGIASKFLGQQTDDKRLVSTLKTYICNEPAFDKDLVQAFDCFAQVNIQRGNPSIIHFCRINLILATLLQKKNQELISLCQNRLKEALAKGGSK